MRCSSGSTSFLASRGSCGTSCLMNLTTLVRVRVRARARARARARVRVGVRTT